LDQKELAGEELWGAAALWFGWANANS